MTDVRLKQNFNPFEPTMDFFLRDNGTLDEREELATAVRVALGTDKLADEDIVLPDPDSTDRRGWWGDMDAESIWDGWPIGTKNWTLTRAKITQVPSEEGSTLERARIYTLEALQPFIDKDVASEVTVEAVRSELHRIDVHAVIYRGPLPEIDLAFQLLWQDDISELHYEVRQELPIGSSISITLHAPDNLFASSPVLGSPGLISGWISSAGVFDANDKLIRTLWSAQHDNPAAGDPVAAWDGTTDDGDVAPTGDYTIKLLKHKIQYTWEGVIGNTSPDHSPPPPPVDNETTLAPRYHQYACTVTDMAITTDRGEIYFTTSYDERWNNTHVMMSDDVQGADYVGRYRGPIGGGAVHSICTDDSYVYFVSYEQGSADYVWAVSTEDYTWPMNFGGGGPGKKRYAIFEYGIPENWDGSLSALAHSTTGQYILDIAVQKMANFLFVLRIETLPDVYSILTIHKVTGQLLAINLHGYVSPGFIAASPTTGELWVIHSTNGGTSRNTVTKHTVDDNGNLTATAVTITGLQNAVNLEVSPDGSTLLVVDAGSSQQVKAFNTSNGSVKTAFGTSGAFGVAGGYANGPAVTNTKFMFKTFAGYSAGTDEKSYLSFAPDGSWWLGDGGNLRNLHFSAGNSPTLIEQFAYIPSFYACQICHNDDTRVFAYFLEFSVDYSKPLGADNGSWQLVNNWAYGVPNPNVDQYMAMKGVGTFSNGHTYTTVLHNDSTRHIWEMTSSGYRDTGKSVEYARTYIDRGFNLWYMPDQDPPVVGHFYKNPFTGFDGSHNPTWQYSSTEYWTWPSTLTTEALPIKFPRLDYIGTHCHNMGEALSNGVIPVYSMHSYNYNAATANHFGGIDSATGNIKFSTHPPTPSNQGGANTFLVYPEAPYFPIGNGLGDYGGGAILYKPNEAHVFTTYSGEMWGNNQTNMLSHWHESGLLLGRFGTTMPWFSAPPARYLLPIPDPDTGPDPIGGWNDSYKGFPGAAGNAFGGGLAHVDGKYYIYQNDEWYHGGIHRWRVENVDTLETDNYSVSWASDNYIEPTPDPDNLLDGLPYNQMNLPNGTAGWYRSPTSDDTSSGYTGNSIWYRVYTNAYKCNPHDPPDLVFENNHINATHYLYKDLQRDNPSNNWTIDSIIQYCGWESDNCRFYIEILDTNGLAIIRLSQGQGGEQYQYHHAFWINDADPIDGTWEINRSQTYVGAPRPLVISANLGSNKLTINYGKWSASNVSLFNGSADISAPARIKFTYAHSGTSSKYVGIVISKLNFTE